MAHKPFRVAEQPKVNENARTEKATLVQGQKLDPGPVKEPIMHDEVIKWPPAQQGADHKPVKNLK